MIEKRKQPLKCVGWVKRILTLKTIMRGRQQVRTMNLQESGQDLGEILLWSSHAENEDENHHELLRHSIIKNRKVESTMKEFGRSWTKAYD